MYFDEHPDELKSYLVDGEDKEKNMPYTPVNIDDLELVKIDHDILRSVLSIKVTK